MDNRGFYITVSTGILRDGHRERMQVNQKTNAIWLYLWFLDKITKIDEYSHLGIVLGGKPIKLEDVDLGCDIKTTRKMFHRLIEEGYIETNRTPYGHQVWVTKAKKKFGWKIDGFGEGKEVESEEERKVKSGRSSKKVVGLSPQKSKNAVGLIKTVSVRDSIAFQENAISVPEKKENPLPVKKLIDSFYVKCERRLGFKPIINGGRDGMLIKTRLRSGLSEAEIEEVFDYFFTSDKSRDHPTVSAALSAHTINLAKEKAHKNKFL